MKTYRSATCNGLAIACFTILWTSLALAQRHPTVQPRAEDVLVPSEGGSMPMLDFGGRPVVDVMINGKGPYKFIFDTGAAFTAVDSSLVAQLSLGDNPKIDEFHVGKVLLRNMHVFASPISQLLGSGDVPRGVLNASAFPGSLVTFDYPAKQISFHRGALAQANGADIFDYDPGDLPSLPVKVAGREFIVHLDTGAPYPFALPTKYMHDLPLTGPPVQKGSAKTQTGPALIFAASLNGDISIGQFKLSTRDLRFSDVVPFAAAVPKGQVGSEALREFVLTLDSMNHRLRLESSGAYGSYGLTK